MTGRRVSVLAHGVGSRGDPVVLGQILGVTRTPEGATRRAVSAGLGQLPLVLALALFTVGGLGLLFGF